jgi:hypothetical protein
MSVIDIENSLARTSIRIGKSLGVTNGLKNKYYFSNLEGVTKYMVEIGTICALLDENVDISCYTRPPNQKISSLMFFLCD